MQDFKLIIIIQFLIYFFSVIYSTRWLHMRLRCNSGDCVFLRVLYSFIVVSLALVSRGLDQVYIG